jgi:hypothetical protein
MNKDVFKIPLNYNKKTKKLKLSILKDIELIESNDDNEKPIYHEIFITSNDNDKKIIEQFASHYTTDKKYLKETQELTNSIQVEEINKIYNKYSNVDNVVSLWDEFKQDSRFYDKYIFIESNFGFEKDFVKELNNNPVFLQILSIYTFISPLLSLILPILMLILPLIIIKHKGCDFTTEIYVSLLQSLMKNNAILKMITQYNDSDFCQKIYLSLSVGLYVFSMYQNIIKCLNFYSNLHKIKNLLFQINRYCVHTVELIELHIAKSHQLTTYKYFNKDLNNHMNVLNEISNKLQNVITLDFTCKGIYSSILKLGNFMHIFYDLYTNESYNKTIQYSFGFHSYVNIIKQIKSSVDENKLTKTIFKNNGKTEFKQVFYPKFIHNQKNIINIDSIIVGSLDSKNNIIKNNFNLDKNIIITGPNASGKTTLLKTALINILMSQQFGFGCFEQCKLTPYEHIHCYLNIPDTSSRDSLFQAEARRCKEIIDSIEENPNELHFCIFDELYSGTNPEEAVDNANAFISYITKKKNISFILTTHFVSLCRKLNKNKTIENFKMNCIENNNDIVFCYTLEKGISYIKGGLKILNDMKYPKEILDLAKNK